MSFMDKIKSWFSGGSGSSDMPATASEPAEMPSAPYDPPAAPVDPMGAPMTGGMPESVPDPEPGAGTDEEGEAENRQY